jgi:CheY-like chemotaxis protein
MKRIPTVLLVEDNKNDALLFRNALKQSSVSARMQVVSDGNEALSYLNGGGTFGNRKAYPLPGMVILDLHIPKLSGLEVLRWIRQQPFLAGIPVVVFTGSDDGQSLAEAMQSGADTYLMKGNEMEGLLQLLQHADLSWKGPRGLTQAAQSSPQLA